MEKKGSLFLRSNHMDYSTQTRVTNWHQVREAEPKDYDIHGENVKKMNLHRSTYGRIGNVTNGELPKSTCHEHMDQIKLKKDFQEKTTRHPVVNLSTFGKISLDRDIGHGDKQSMKNVLPKHPNDHNKRYLDTTYGIDYRQPYEYSQDKKETQEVPEGDKSRAYKKCHSQFTDTADYRRPGLNTWQDESGQYANGDIKRETFKPTNTIPERLL
eukprot:gene397-1031_t